MNNLKKLGKPFQVLFKKNEKNKKKWKKCLRKEHYIFFFKKLKMLKF